MAKYSNRLAAVEFNYEYPKPHIFKHGRTWVYFPMNHRLKGGNSLNLIAQSFCQKLNNAAPKRGLKA